MLDHSCCRPEGPLDTSEVEATSHALHHAAALCRSAVRGIKLDPADLPAIRESFSFPVAAQARFFILFSIFFLMKCSKCMQ